jgi:hypothetical protein
VVSGDLAPGDARLLSGEWMDVYFFNGTPGMELTIDLQSSDFDTYLMLIMPSGGQIDNDDIRPAVGTDSQISLGLEEAGEHLVAVTSYAVGEMGGYQISMTPGLSGTPTVMSPALLSANSILPGQSLQGTLQEGDQVLTAGEFMDLYSFTGSAGETYSISMTSTEIDPYIIFIHPDGTQEDNDDARIGSYDAGLVVTLRGDGECQIGATSYAPRETGLYQVTVARAGAPEPVPVPPVTPPVTPPTSPVTPPTEEGIVMGELTNQDAQLYGGEYADAYTFRGQAGQQVSISMESSAIDTYLILTAPSGDTEDNDDAHPNTLNSMIQTTLPETGEYTITCTTYAPEELGPYILTFTGGNLMEIDAEPVIADGRQYYGVFCGISDYAPLGPGGSDLPLCRGDALKLADALTDMGVMPAENVITLVDEEGTVENIEAAFQQLGSRVNADDVFIFFYSGHGGQRRTGVSRTELDGMDEYLVTFTGDAVTDDRMTELFDLVNAEIALICLDACFSGGFAKDVIVAQGRMGLFSSEEDLTSDVASKFQSGGYLSHFFLMGVTGEADDDPQDQRLSVGEICHYLQVQFGEHVSRQVTSVTRRQTSGYQHLVVDRSGVKIEDILISIQ